MDVVELIQKGENPERSLTKSYMYMQQIMENMPLIIHMWILIVATDVSPGDQATRGRLAATQRSFTQGKHINVSEI